MAPQVMSAPLQRRRPRRHLRQLEIDARVGARLAPSQRLPSAALQPAMDAVFAVDARVGARLAPSQRLPSAALQPAMDAVFAAAFEYLVQLNATNEAATVGAQLAGRST